jgi:hypothetical protein
LFHLFVLTDTEGEQLPNSSTTRRRSLKDRFKEFSNEVSNFANTPEYSDALFLFGGAFDFAVFFFGVALLESASSFNERFPGSFSSFGGVLVCPEFNEGWNNRQ